MPRLEPSALHIDIVTLFPALFEGPLNASIIGRARARQLVDVEVHDLRDWTSDRHRSADDTPYGGGAGMVMMAPPIVHAVEALTAPHLMETRVVFLSASGRPFSQAVARDFATLSRLVLVCGHYEGIDQRAVDLLDGDEISIGDYVLTGGEIPALVVVDAVTRLLPGVIDHASTEEESFETGLLEYPHYTRPASFRGLDVPAPLLSGHHGMVARWRRTEALRRTWQRRPDLLQRDSLSEADRLALDAMSSPQDDAKTSIRRPDATGE